MRLIPTGTILALGAFLLWPQDGAQAANPECQTMSIKTSTGERDVLMCKDANGRWYEAGQAAAPATVQGSAGGVPARARMSYQGSYEVTVNNPAKPKRNPTLLDLASNLQGKKIQGALTFDLKREGQTLTGSMTVTGANPPRNSVTGTMQNGVCKLYTNETVHEGRCDENGFSGQVSSTGAVTQKVKGTFQTNALKIVDVALEEKQQAENARVAAQTAAAEQAKTAQSFALLKAGADAGNIDRMDELAEAYRTGTKGAPLDVALAARWFDRSAAKGSVWGAYKAGTFYDLGAGVVEDRAKAHRYYLQCANGSGTVRTESGKDVIAECMALVASNFYKGRGVVRNETEAVRWYKSCARRGGNECIEWLNEHGVSL